MREGEDEQVAFAGDDDGEEAAVRGNGKFAESKAVKNGHRSGLSDRDFLVGRNRGERRDGEPNDVAGFFFERAFEENAGAVDGPSKDAEADANTRKLIGMQEAADFEDLAINEIRGHGAIGRNGEAAFVAVERGEFFVGVAEDVEILQARRAAHGVVLLDGDREIHSGEPGDVAKRAALVWRRKGTGGEARGFDGEERKRRHGLGEVGDGVVVGEEGRVGGVEDEIVAFADAEFVAGVVKEKRLNGVDGVAAILLNGGGEKLDEEIVAVGRPTDGIGQVTDELVAARVFLAFEKAAALAACVLNPDVVVLEVVLFGFEVVVNGKSDAAVGAEGKGGDFLVDGGKRFVEVLGAREADGAAADDGADHCAEFAEPAETAAGRRAAHGFAGAFERG